MLKKKKSQNEVIKKNSNLAGVNDFCGRIGEIKAGKPDEALMLGTEIRYGQFMEDMRGVGK